MLKKTHRTAVVIIPPREIWPPIQAIRKQHDRQFRRWMPHITLIYPFRPIDEFDAAAERFREVCASVQSFQVRLATFGFFQHSAHNCTLWLAPEPEDRISKLQTLLWEVVPDCDEVRRHRNGFMPHLSLGQARGKEEATRLVEDLQATWTPLTFDVSEVSFIWRENPPDDVFRVRTVIKLQL